MKRVRNKSWFNDNIHNFDRIWNYKLKRQIVAKLIFNISTCIKYKGILFFGTQNLPSFSSPTVVVLSKEEYFPTWMKQFGEAVVQK